jgi:hypothetical protein
VDAHVDEPLGPRVRDAHEELAVLLGGEIYRGGERAGLVAARRGLAHAHDEWVADVSGLGTGARRELGQRGRLFTRRGSDHVRRKSVQRHTSRRNDDQLRSVLEDRGAQAQEQDRQDLLGVRAGPHDRARL